MSGNKCIVENEDKLYRTTSKARHTFGVSFWGWFDVEPNTSFPDCWCDKELNNLEPLFSASGWCCFNAGQIVDAVGCVAGLPSKRLAEPVNALNLGIFAAGSSIPEKGRVKTICFRDLINKSNNKKSIQIIGQIFYIKLRKKPSGGILFDRGIDFGFSGSL